MESQKGSDCGKVPKVMLYRRIGTDGNAAIVVDVMTPNLSLFPR
jgi:hypothetical protein